MLEYSADGGATVQQAAVQFVSSSELRLTASGVPSGLYYVRVKNPDGQLSNVQSLTL